MIGNKKKKVTIITLQNIRNYGSVLQALATQNLFESLNCEVDFINYWRPDTISVRRKIDRHCQGMGLIKKILTAISLIATYLRQDYLYQKFIKNYLHVQKEKMSTLDDFVRISLTSDFYCTGSDQTWNSGWNDGIRKELFLDFVPDNIPKIAYAASMGKSKLEDWEIEETRHLLKRYSFISVRENAAVNICNDLGVEGAVHVIDPTLQMTRSYWMNFIRKPKIKGYVLIYQLNKSPQFDNYAAEVARRNGLKVIRLCFAYSQLIKSGKSLLLPEVTEFIGYIANADCVITDSFHATAFSINLNVSFISIYPSSYGSRIASLLDLTSLQSRHLTDFNDFSLADNLKIDFKYANIVLDEERRKTEKYLKEAIWKE